jgi:hypothetical protein
LCGRGGADARHRRPFSYQVIDTVLHQLGLPVAETVIPLRAEFNKTLTVGGRSFGIDRTPLARTRTPSWPGRSTAACRSPSCPIVASSRSSMTPSPGSTAAPRYRPPLRTTRLAPTRPTRSPVRGRTASCPAAHRGGALPAIQPRRLAPQNPFAHWTGGEACRVRAGAAVTESPARAGGRRALRRVRGRDPRAGAGCAGRTNTSTLPTPRQWLA